MEIYTELEKETLHIMTDYQKDLTTHDKNAITENAGVPFLHFTRQTGTYLTFLSTAESYPVGKVKYLLGVSDKYQILNNKKQALYSSTIKHMTKKICYFDGRKLTVIGYNKAIEIMADYVIKIENIWSKQRKAV